MNVRAAKIAKVDEAAESSAADRLDSDTQRVQRTLERLDRLIDVLERAELAFRCVAPRAREEALAHGLSVIGALYGEVDIVSAETTARLVAAYDSCLDALGAAYAGDCDALLPAMTMAHAIRSALSHGSCRAGCSPCAPTRCRAA